MWESHKPCEFRNCCLLLHFFEVSISRDGIMYIVRYIVHVRKVLVQYNNLRTVRISTIYVL